MNSPRTPRLIRLLDAQTQNQIAAGEVVERPGSVIKELVENALDAGASRIEVAVVDGGLSSIVVTDNGAGMSAEQAKLSLLRHATSKLTTVNDLESLASFGFRGEALPSIASVSRFQLITRTDGEDAVRFEVSAEGIAGPFPASGPIGTSVHVADLFYNVPARRKFMKSTATEHTHVVDQVFAAALVRHDVGFVLTRDRKKVLEYLPVATRAERVRACLDRAPLTAFAFERGPMQVEAFLSSPQHNVASPSALHFFVRGRPIRDRALAKAAALAFGDALPQGRFPQGAIFLELPGSLVDINVHPQKSEVRFADGRAVFDAIHRGIADQLAMSAASSEEGVRTNQATSSTPLRAPYRSARETMYNARNRERETAHLNPNAVATARVWAAQMDVGATPVEANRAPSVAEVRDSGAATYELAKVAEVEPVFDAAKPSAVEGPSFYGSMSMVGIDSRTCVIAERSDALYLLDGIAVLQRSVAERLTRSLLLGGEGLVEVDLRVHVGASAVDILTKRVRHLGSRFLVMEAAGREFLAIREVPVFCKDLGEQAWADMLLMAAGAGNDVGAERTLIRELAHLVVEQWANTWSLAQLRAELMKALGALDSADFSLGLRRGRPLLMRIGRDELERKLK
jgi:DNA mismatch repair protein MutL